MTGEQIRGNKKLTNHVNNNFEHAREGVCRDGGNPARVRRRVSSLGTHADAVNVVGSFNDWSPDSHPMTKEGDGYWYTDIPSAAVGDEYRYRIVSGDKELMRIDPYARQVTSSVGNAVVYDPDFDWEGDDFHLPPVNELVIYEMHLGTFHDKEDGKTDKFAEAVQKLDHLQRLGVNVMEVMPLAQFAGDLSWGYNPSCVFAVETNYGGAAGFKRFVKAAHRAGLGVILDVVYNHFGPSDLDLWQFDGWSENGMGGIYFYNDWHADTPWGLTRPDYGRKEVRQFIRDNALMWLEEYHVNGLRFDMTLYIHNVRASDDPDGDLPDGWSLVQWINREVRQAYPGRITIAEDLQNDDRITKPVDQGGGGSRPNGPPASCIPCGRPSSRPTTTSARWTASARRSRAATTATRSNASSTASRTTRWRTEKPASLRRSTPTIPTVGSRRNARPWRRPWCSRRRASRCCFRDRSSWKTAGSRIRSRWTGTSRRSSAGWCGCIGT